MDAKSNDVGADAREVQKEESRVRDYAAIAEGRKSVVEVQHENLLVRARGAVMIPAVFVRK